MEFRLWHCSSVFIRRCCLSFKVFCVSGIQGCKDFLDVHGGDSSFSWWHVQGGYFGSVLWLNSDHVRAKWYVLNSVLIGRGDMWRLRDGGPKHPLNLDTELGIKSKLVVLKGYIGWGDRWASNQRVTHELAPGHLLVSARHCISVFTLVVRSETSTADRM